MTNFADQAAGARETWSWSDNFPHCIPWSANSQGHIPASGPVLSKPKHGPDFQTSAFIDFAGNANQVALSDLFGIQAAAQLSNYITLEPGLAPAWTLSSGIPIATGVE